MYTLIYIPIKMLFNPLNKKCMDKKCFLLMLFMLWTSKTEFRFSDLHDPGTDLGFLLCGFWYQPARLACHGRALTGKPWLTLK